MGMAPPCFPNFLSKLSWTDTEEREMMMKMKMREVISTLVMSSLK